MEDNKVNVLNRFFTRNTIQNLLENNWDSTYSSVVSRYFPNADSMINRELISSVYRVLEKDYRNEYYYKNTLINKLLLGVHSLNTTTALTEISISKSKADFILINGKAIVYEIKTELDNLDRLCSQIDDYYKAFDHVVVVTFEKNVSRLYDLLEKDDRPIGICVVRKNGRICTVKEPQKYRKDLDEEILFKLLRKREFEKIVIDKYGRLPDVSQFKYYSCCKELLMKMSVDELYTSVINVLKQRSQIDKEEFAKIPYEMRFLAYFMKLKGNDYRKLELFLDSQYGGR